MYGWRESPEQFGRRIQKLREKRRVSRKTMAELIGISRTSLGNYERGDRAPDIIVASKIADYFDISMDELLGRKRE